MKARNFQIDKHTSYVNFHSIIDTTMNIDNNTETEAEQIILIIVREGKNLEVFELNFASLMIMKVAKIFERKCY